MKSLSNQILVNQDKFKFQYYNLFILNCNGINLSMNESRNYQRYFFCSLKIQRVFRFFFLFNKLSAFFFFFFCEFKKPNVKDGIFPPSHPASFYVNWYQRWFRIQDSPYSTSTYVTVSNFLVNVDRNGHFMRSSSITRQRFIPLLL